MVGDEKIWFEEVNLGKKGKLYKKNGEKEIYNEEGEERSKESNKERIRGLGKKKN